MKTMATNNGTILQFVYYYPPLNGDINDVNITDGLGSYYLPGLSYYDISYAQPSPFGIPEVDFVSGFWGQENLYESNMGGNKYTIFLTPQAYVSWYQNAGIDGLIIANPQYTATNTYLKTLYNYCNETPSYPLSTIENNTIVFPTAINEWYYTIQTLNIKFVPYNQNYATDGYTLGNSALDPVKTYNLSSYELYMMVIPPATISSTTSTSTSITNATNYYNRVNGIETEETSFQNAQSTEYTTQLNENTNGAKLMDDINNIPNDISKALTGPDGWIYWLGIGVVAIVGVLAIAMALKK